MYRRQLHLLAGEGLSRRADNFRQEMAEFFRIFGLAFQVKSRCCGAEGNGTGIFLFSGHVFVDAFGKLTGANDQQAGCQRIEGAGVSHLLILMRPLTLRITSNEVQRSGLSISIILPSSNVFISVGSCIQLQFSIYNWRLDATMCNATVCISNCQLQTENCKLFLSPSPPGLRCSVMDLHCHSAGPGRYSRRTASYIAPGLLLRIPYMLTAPQVPDRVPQYHQNGEEAEKAETRRGRGRKIYLTLLFLRFMTLIS